MKNLRLYNSDFYGYMELLAKGEIYHILISKHLLLKSVAPLWGLLFLLFFVRSGVFFGIAVLPAVFLYFIHILRLYDIWSACGITKSRYASFHIVAVLILKLSAFGIGEIVVCLIG